MRNSAWLALVWAACLLAAPASAQPVSCDLDVEQPLTGRGFYFTADTPRWQEIIPSREFLCEVRITVRVDQLGSDLLLRLEDDVGALVDESSIDAAQLVLGTGEYVFDFDTAVTPDELHRLVLTTDQPDAFPAACFWFGDEDSLYDDGVSDVHGGGIPGFDYSFWVTTGTLTAVSEVPDLNPFVLHDAKPNPFNPSTTLAFDVTTTHHVRLTIHDAAGRLVTTLLDQVCDAGRHEALWDGQDSHQRLVASGVYLYQIQVGESVESRRAVLLK